MAALGSAHRAGSGELVSSLAECGVLCCAMLAIRLSIQPILLGPYNIVAASRLKHVRFTPDWKQEHYVSRCPPSQESSLTVTTCLISKGRQHRSLR